MRNLAIEEKIKEKAEGKTDPNVIIPRKYTSWREDAQYD
jgi:hypothetical protein